MVWQLLAKPLLGVATDAVKGFVETKKAKQELKLTEVKAATKLKEDQIAGKVKWEQTAVEQMKGSWKDEFVLLALMIPAICAFLPFMQPQNVALKSSVGFLNITATFCIWRAQFHWGYVRALPH